MSRHGRFFWLCLRLCELNSRNRQLFNFVVVFPISYRIDRPFAQFTLTSTIKLIAISRNTNRKICIAWPSADSVSLINNYLEIGIRCWIRRIEREASVCHISKITVSIWSKWRENELIKVKENRKHWTPSKFIEINSQWNMKRKWRITQLKSSLNGKPFLWYGLAGLVAKSEKKVCFDLEFWFAKPTHRFYGYATINRVIE